MQIKSIAECSFCNTFDCIKLPFVFKTFVLCIFEWPLKTGYTVKQNKQSNNGPCCLFIMGVMTGFGHAMTFIKV